MLVGLETPFASLAAAWSTARGKYVLELSLVFAAYLPGGRIGLVVPFTSGLIAAGGPALAFAAIALIGAAT